MINSFCKLCNETAGKEVLDVSSCDDTYLDYMGIEYKDLKDITKSVTIVGLLIEIFSNRYRERSSL